MSNHSEQTWQMWGFYFKLYLSPTLSLLAIISYNYVSKDHLSVGHGRSIAHLHTNLIWAYNHLKYSWISDDISISDLNSLRKINIWSQPNTSTFLQTSTSKRHAIVTSPKQLEIQAMWLDETFYFLDTYPKHWKINSLWLVSLEVEGYEVQGRQWPTFRVFWLISVTISNR